MRSSRIITLTIIALLAAMLLIGCNAAQAPEVPEVVAPTPEPTPEIELLLCAFCDVLKVEAEHCEIPLEACIVCDEYKVEEEHCEPDLLLCSVCMEMKVFDEHCFCNCYKQHRVANVSLCDRPVRLSPIELERRERIAESIGGDVSILSQEVQLVVADINEQIEFAVDALVEEAYEEQVAWLESMGARQVWESGSVYYWRMTSRIRSDIREAHGLERLAEDNDRVNLRPDVYFGDRWMFFFNPYAWRLENADMIQSVSNDVWEYNLT